MCNAKNTELIRQQLWCDIVTSNNGELTFDKILAEADKLVAEFDKRFLYACAGSELSKFKEVSTSLHTTAEEVAENLERMKKEKPLRDATTYEEERPPLRDTTTYIERGPNPRAYSVQELGIIDWDSIYRPNKFTFASLINNLLK